MGGVSGSGRNCASCGLPLSRYNTDDRCQSCLRTGMPPRRPEGRRRRVPDYLPAEVLARADFRDACARQDFGAMFSIIYAYRDQGWTLSHIGRRCEMSASSVKGYINGRQAASVYVIERVSDGFHIPGEMLGIGRRRWETESVAFEPGVADTKFEQEKLGDWRLTEQLRRTFLAGGLSALTLPALGLDELKRITAAVVNAQRYADGDVVDYFKRQLDSCATYDGKRGPRQSLPIVLGLVAAIEKMATDAKPPTRRDLLRVGAYASEFAGWLYRDICAPELANYWRDRAIEWAQVSGDATMQGYVLLKKSQAVWDERDALRMLTLAEAVQEGPWRLPPRVRAEAAQQQARGHAMLDGNLPMVEAKLGEAQSLLSQDNANSETRRTDIAAHYDEALFGLQMAICYCEASQPERSLELYDRWLSPETFSRRDYAYFLALKGETHAVAQEPDNAAMAGLEAFSLARETESMRTVQEVTRLAVQLDKWSNRESVHELRKSTLVGS